MINEYDMDFFLCGDSDSLTQLFFTVDAFSISDPI